MKRFTSFLKITILASLALAHCSCVSAVIDRSTNKHRDILSKGHSRAEIRKKVGIPESSWDRLSRNKPLYGVYGSHAYDVFRVRGVVARPGDGAAQATTSAVTLGAGEAISLPFTLAGVVAKPFTTQKLVVFYNRNLDYRKHEIYDSKGNKIDNLGY